MLIYSAPRSCTWATLKQDRCLRGKGDSTRQDPADKPHAGQPPQTLSTPSGRKCVKLLCLRGKGNSTHQDPADKPRAGQPPQTLSTPSGQKCVKRS